MQLGDAGQPSHVAHSTTSSVNLCPMHALTAHAARTAAQETYDPATVHAMTLRTRTNSPYTGDYQLRNQIRGAYAWGAGPCAMGADYYVGRGGRRYACY